MPLSQICQISGRKFTISDHEMQLRRQFGFEDMPTVLPRYRLQQIGAFYPNWGLYKRTCDKTKKEIISTFADDCPYPVWDRQEWFKSANPPCAKVDFDRPFFDQAREVFTQSPIPHIFQFQCENCEFANDWYKSKDCYLCHGGSLNEGVRYSARCNNYCKDCLYSVTIVGCQWCFDCTNCDNAYRCIHCLDVRDTQNCAMCYDCRNCRDCLFCFNLRGKQYCIGNIQFSQEQYQLQRQKWKLETRTGYHNACEYFVKMMHEIAWLRAVSVEDCENSTGNYIHHMKDCETCFMEFDHDNCCHGLWSGGGAKHICEGLGTFGCHGGYKVAMPIKCFEVRFAFVCFESKFSEYIGYCVGCENCFGCCGLHKKNYCLFNNAYSNHEYSELRNRLIDHMKSTGEWGHFFPGVFAPNVYEDSMSATFWPLDEHTKNLYLIRTDDSILLKSDMYRDISDIPETAFDADDTTPGLVFWDEKAHKPFTILPHDINFCRELSIPLPDRYYMRRIFENLSWMPFDGELRTTRCAKSGKDILTSWPADYDGRIVGEEEYLKMLN